MKLSNAMRAGAATRDQINGQMFDVFLGQISGCCAIGALAIGALGEPLCASNKLEHTIMSELRSTYPVLRSLDPGKTLLRHFGLDDHEAAPSAKNLERVIMFLNDETHYTTEQIASALDALKIA
jgi:hypothetical protein